MGALLPLVGKAPAVANPAEKAVLGSSFDTFLITSILDTICLPLGGFSGTEYELLIEKLLLKKKGHRLKKSAERSYPTHQHGEPLRAFESQAFQLFQGSRKAKKKKKK